jgi:hypothetical protein
MHYRNDFITIYITQTHLVRLPILIDKNDIKCYCIIQYRNDFEALVVYCEFQNHSLGIVRIQKFLLP